MWVVERVVYGNGVKSRLAVVVALLTMSFTICLLLFFIVYIPKLGLESKKGLSLTEEIPHEVLACWVEYKHAFV